MFFYRLGRKKVVPIIGIKVNLFDLFLYLGVLVVDGYAKACRR
jgi:hypothetical protein